MSLSAASGGTVPLANPLRPQTVPSVDRRVLPIDGQVRNLLGLYLSIFRNYEEAARAIHISKDTVAKYFEGNPNIALYVFDRMYSVVVERVEPVRVKDALEGATYEEIISRARERNGQQIDTTMYRMTPRLREILALYTSSFPSRARAAAKIGVNPRTFKAYVKGDISSFPKGRFEQVLKVLREKGHSEKDLLQVAGVADWSELVAPKVRPDTTSVSENDVIKEIMSRFESGSLNSRTLDKNLQVAATRIFGDLGGAIRAAMKQLEERLLKSIENDIAKGNFTDAFRDIRRLEKFIGTYAMRERTASRAANYSRKREWADEIRSMRERKNRLKLQVFKALKIYDFPDDRPELVENIRTPDIEHEVSDYDPSLRYEPGDILKHPEFGVGRVVKVTEPRMIQVTFGPRTGEKTLVMNSHGARPELRPA